MTGFHSLELFHFEQRLVLLLWGFAITDSLSADIMAAA
jgi:hypothetical protein